MSAAPPDDDDDLHWLQLLSGRHVHEPDRRTAQEAAWLRAALLAYRAQAPAGAPAAPEQRVARLIERARAAGVLPPSAPQRPARAARWALRGFSPSRLLQRWPSLSWPLAGALATAALVSLVLPWKLIQEPPDDGATVLRGDAVQTRPAADPTAAREALRAALAAAGLEAAPYQRLDRLGLDLELPQPLTPAQRETLTRLGVTPPSGPSLRIEFVAPAASR